MGKFRELLERDWLKYGFETFAVLIGVLGAFALENWQDKLRDRQKEKEYVQNLVSDVNSQLSIISDQVAFETIMRTNCEDLIDLLNASPAELDKIGKLASNISRRTFVVYNPVFEDLKYSGHLSLLSRTEQKNAVLGFYQLAEYVELVLSKNNGTYADAVTLYLVDNGLADFGNTLDSLNPANLNFSLDAELHAGSEEIINGNLQENNLRFGLHNKVAIRGRASSVHIDLLNRLYKEGESVIELLTD